MLNILMLLLCAASFAKTDRANSDFLSAKEAGKLTREAMNEVDSKVYEAALNEIEKRIYYAVERGDDVIVVDMDGLVYGNMMEKIEETLKSKGYQAKWNYVGGIKGTSYRMYLQISWMSER